VARHTIVQLTDDIDGNEGTETISFSYRGTNYEIDLNAKNAAALDKAIAKYIDAARRVSGGHGPSRGRGARRVASHRRTGDVAAIREWARENGYQVSTRGRIAAEIREAYEAANS
jgi:hypothetical protein